MKLCEKCGATLDDAVQICYNCKTKVGEQPELKPEPKPEPSHTKFCSKCGAQIAADAQICTNCGCLTGMAKDLAYNMYTANTQAQNAAPTQNNSSSTIWNGMFGNGILAFLLGCIGAISGNNIEVDWVLRLYDSAYDQIVESVRAMADAFIAVIICGIVMITCGIVFRKRQQIKNKLFWIVPMIIILSVSVAMFIPLIQFNSY